MLPRAWSTAPPGGIAVRPPEVTAATVPVRSAASVAGGKSVSTTSTEPTVLGVVLPQAGVKSEMPSGVSILRFTFWSGWAGAPAACHEPTSRKMSTNMRPSTPSARPDRRRAGGDERTPSRRNTPELSPDWRLKKSPLTPTVVAWGLRRPCMPGTAWRPRTVPCVRTGRTRYRSPCGGVRTTWRTTGLPPLMRSDRSYVTPGSSATSPAPAPAGTASATVQAAHRRPLFSTRKHQSTLTARPQANGSAQAHTFTSR